MKTSSGTVAHELHGLPGALAFAHPTPHALLPQHSRRAVDFDSAEGAGRFTLSASVAEPGVHAGHVPRRGDVPHPVLDHALEPAAAALAAIADGVEPVQHYVLEPGGVQVTPLVFLFEKIEGPCLRQAAAGLGVVLQDEVRKGLPDDHAV